MKKFLLILSISFISCSSDDEETITTSQRWVDRQIYFAVADGSDPDRNNFFQKERIQESIGEIELITSFGPGYFNFTEVSETLLIPTTGEALVEDQRSFILIWPDAVFNDFVVNTLGGGTPDQNAVTVINAANKRKFYMIFKASCFNTTATCNNIGVDGFKALVARQFGFLMGLGQADCSVNPTSVMCASNSFISDSQWSENSQIIYANSMNNILEQILNTPGFYSQ